MPSMAEHGRISPGPSGASPVQNPDVHFAKLSIWLSKVYHGKMAWQDLNMSIYLDILLGVVSPYWYPLYANLQKAIHSVNLGYLEREGSE